jgi:hypothetical protein
MGRGWPDEASVRTWVLAGFTFVDTKKDGLSNILLTHLTENTTALFMNGGLSTKRRRS